MKTKVACSTFYCKHFDFEKSECSFKKILILGGECIQFEDNGEKDGNPPK